MSYYLQKHDGHRFHAEYNLSWQEFHIWMVFHRGEYHQRVKDITINLEEPDTRPEGVPTCPTMRFSEAEAQALFDSLWGAGLRPRDWGQKPTDVAGVKDEVISAKDEHIRDLRRTIFDHDHRTDPVDA